MKAYKIVVKTAPVEGFEGGLNYGDLLKTVILNGSESGMSTDLMLQTQPLLANFIEAQAKAVASEWIWYITPEQYYILDRQLDGMRWAETSYPLRVAVVDFIKSIKDAVQEEVN